MSRFDQLPAREQKRVIQSVVIKAIVLDDSTLNLTLRPDPANPEAWENKMITARDQKPDPGRNVEFTFSRCAGNGGEGPTYFLKMFSTSP